MLVGGGLATRARVTLVAAADFTSCQHFLYQGGRTMWLKVLGTGAILLFIV